MTRSPDRPWSNVPLMGLLLGVGALVLYTVFFTREAPHEDPPSRQPLDAPTPEPSKTEANPVVVVSPPTPTPTMIPPPAQEAPKPDERPEPPAADDHFAEGWTFRSVVGNIIELDFGDGATKDVRLGKPFDPPDGGRAVIVEIESDPETVIVKREADGKLFRIPRAAPRPTEDEMDKALAPDLAWMKRTVQRFAPGWEIAYCGDDVRPGLQDEWGGRKNVLVTHPLDQSTGCILFVRKYIPPGRKTSLRLTVGHDPRGDWDLIVRANGKELLRQTIGEATATKGWADVNVDLTPLAGRQVKLELVNQPTGWYWETAYWGKISIESE